MINDYAIFLREKYFLKIQNKYVLYKKVSIATISSYVKH